jgi:hypothetical protein
MVTWFDGGDPVISGSEALTKPGGSQFTVAGGNGPYVWSIAGTGVTIDQNGYVTMGNNACGSFFVTCTDCTGRSNAHVGTRVTNNGTWYSPGVSWNCAVYGGSVYSVQPCPLHPHITDSYCYLSTVYGGFVEDIEVISGAYKAFLYIRSGSVGSNYYADCPVTGSCENAVVNLYVASVDADCAGIPGAVSSYAYLIAAHVYGIMVGQQVSEWRCN